MTPAAEFRVEPQPGDATAAIAAALAAAAEAGGGRVVLAAGRHRAGAIALGSGIELHLAAGAILEAAADPEAFASNRAGVIAEASDIAFIHASGADGVAITGPGRIEGGGVERWSLGFDAALGVHTPRPVRPRLIVLEDCRRVTIRDLAIADSPMWTVHLAGCAEVRIAGLAIENDRALPNTDGIVVDSCRAVRIEDCRIATADDGIVLKTTLPADGRPPRACRDVEVRRCTVESRSTALKIGTESHADIADIVFEDCAVIRSNRGLGIFSRDGGRIERVAFRRIALDCTEAPDGFWGSGEALTITVVDRRAERPAGSVADIEAADITGRMEGAINLVALRPGAIDRIHLDRLRLSQRPGPIGTADHYDLRPTAADLAVPEGAEGRPNAWIRDGSGRILGLVPYPGGLPGLFAAGVGKLDLSAIEIERPDPLPAGWNPRAIVVI